MMSKEKVEMKTFNMKMTKELWLFLKRNAVAKELSMTEIVNTCVEKYRKQEEKNNLPA
jgi:hypothetical protein